MEIPKVAVANLFIVHTRYVIISMCLHKKEPVSDQSSIISMKNVFTTVIFEYAEGESEIIDLGMSKKSRIVGRRALSSRSQTNLAKHFQKPRKFFSKKYLWKNGSKFFPKKIGVMELKILIWGDFGGGRFGSKLFRHPLSSVCGGDARFGLASTVGGGGGTQRRQAGNNGRAQEEEACHGRIFPRSCRSRPFSRAYRSRPPSDTCRKRPPSRACRSRPAPRACRSRTSLRVLVSWTHGGSGSHNTGLIFG